jgi:histone deacetylase 6
MNEHTALCASLAVGGLLKVVRAVIADQLVNAFALIRPPGHHAEPHTAMGFSFLNNVAVAARVATKVLGVPRVCVLDWDIHHGNGTQKVFYSDPSVLYISIHRHDNGSFFPYGPEGGASRVGSGEGTGYNINIPLHNRTSISDAHYVNAFNSVVFPVIREYGPQLILVSAGFDAVVGDPVGGCDVSPTCFEWMTHELQKACQRVVLTLEGGYRPSMVATCVHGCVRALIGESDERDLREWKDAIEDVSGAAEALEQTKRAHAAYWRCLRTKEGAL